MKDFSCFAIQRALHLISKEIISISELRDGSLLLLVKSTEIAKKFLTTKQLLGLCKIECSLHRSLNYTKGIIYAPYVNNVSDDEIVSELASQSVVEIYKFTRNIDGKQIPSGVILISFDLYNLPDKINVSWHLVKVREYIPNSMRCKNCQLLGHTSKRCQNPTSCVNCNLPPHPDLQCTRTYPAAAKECQKCIQQKEILTIKTTEKCSMREARQIHKTQSTPFNFAQTYSSAAAATNPTVSNETQKPQTSQINKINSQKPEVITLSKNDKTPSNPPTSKINTANSIAPSSTAPNYLNPHNKTETDSLYSTNVNPLQLSDPNLNSYTETPSTLSDSTLNKLIARRKMSFDDDI